MGVEGLEGGKCRGREGKRGGRRWGRGRRGYRWGQRGVEVEIGGMRGLRLVGGRY